MISTKLTVLSFHGKVTATTNKIQIPGHEGNFQGKKKSEYCTLLAVLLKFLSARLNSSLVFCRLCSMVASSLHSSLPEWENIKSYYSCHTIAELILSSYSTNQAILSLFLLLWLNRVTIHTLTLANQFCQNSRITSKILPFQVLPAHNSPLKRKILYTENTAPICFLKYSPSSQPCIWVANLRVVNFAVWPGNAK